jgi:predicted CoA-binding protein
MSAEEDALKSCRVIAVVGLSSNPERPSNSVARYLKEHGYKIIPVNPNEKMVLGEICYPSLRSIPGKVEVVDIFRKSEDVLPIVLEAIEKGAKTVWMQEGIVNVKAAGIAKEAGLTVVMDKCMRKIHETMIQNR